MMLRYQVNCPEPIPDVFSGIEISTETEKFKLILKQLLFFLLS